MAPRQDEERRRFSRIAFQRPADLRVGNDALTCEVVDISLRGALVEVPASVALEAGQQCALSIRLDGGEAVIGMDGQISHREGKLVGIRCTEIDLESIAHLRRLVELNLGDDEALHRELAALVSQRR